MDTGNSYYASWYYRVSVNTTWFPFAQFVSYMALCIFGWTYISLVSVQRKDPFAGPRPTNTYIDFYIMVITVPFIFLVSGLIVMR